MYEMGRRPKLIIAEHLPRVTETLLRVLQPLDAAVAVESSGDDLWWRIGAEEEFDLVLASAWLPGASGVEVLARLRQSGKVTPFVLLNAISDGFFRLSVNDPRSAPGSPLSTRAVNEPNFRALIASLLPGGGGSRSYPEPDALRRLDRAARRSVPPTFELGAFV